MYNIKYENRPRVRVIAICKVKDKWIVTLDLVGGRLLSAIPAATHHLLGPTN